MPFGDNSLMLHHADRHRALQEIARVKKPEGTILLYDLSRLIVDATQQLRTGGLTWVERSGGLMARLAARRSSAPTGASSL